MSTETRFRIGELSRRTGVSPELLRAWERRYGLLHPDRSAGGLRLYTLDDLERVQAMRERIAYGLSAAEAAAAVTATAEQTTAPAFDARAAHSRLVDATLTFDEATAQSTLDAAIGALSVDALVTDLVLPLLQDVGDRWQRGDLSVAREHFISNIVRARLLGLARGWGRGLGPRAVLACPSGELHDIALVAFGLALREHGWRIAFLGADTPFENVAEAARALDADLVVVSSVSAEPLRVLEEPLRALARRRRVVLAGPGAAHAEIRAARIDVVEDDPVAAAARVAAA